MSSEKRSFLLGTVCGALLVAVISMYMLARSHAVQNMYYLAAFDARFDVIRFARNGPDSLRQLCNDSERVIIPNMIVSIDKLKPTSDEVMDRYTEVEKFYENSDVPLRADAAEIIRSAKTRGPR